VPAGKLQEKNINKIILFVSLKSLKKGVRSRVGSRYRSISQRYGSVDPDPHQNVTDPQHCFNVRSGRDIFENHKKQSFS
jgi:hypothetical protein